MEADHAGDLTLRSYRRAVALVLAVVAALALTSLGASRPLDAHEAYVARSATEMLRRDDWVLPYFNGQPRLQKPPLNYWLGMAAHAASGGTAQQTVSETSARLPSALAAVALAALSIALARVIGAARRTALTAGVIAGVSLGAQEWAHNAQPEMLYAACCALEVLGFALARRASTRTERLRGATLGWLGFVLAVLSKGPLLPAMLWIGASVALCIERRRWNAWLALWPLLGLSLLLVGCAPWVAAVVAREPHAWEFWKAQMFDRTGGASAAWWRPFKLAYVGAALALLAPWSLAALAGLIQPWRARATDERRAARFLWIAVAVPMLILSFSAKAKHYYLLPALAPLAVLAAVAVQALWQRQGSDEAGPPRVRWIVRAHATLAIAAALTAAVWSLRRDFTVDVGVFARGASYVAFAGAAGCGVWAWRASAWPAFVRLATAFALVLFGRELAGLDIPRRRLQDAQFASEVGRVAGRERELIVIDGNAQLLAYYADRRVREGARAQVGEVLAATPDAWFVDEERAWSAAGHAGRVLVRDNSGADDARALIDPRGTR